MPLWDLLAPKLEPLQQQVREDIERRYTNHQ